jgi:hypothetical protein
MKQGNQQKVQARHEGYKVEYIAEGTGNIEEYGKVWQKATRQQETTVYDSMVLRHRSHPRTGRRRYKKTMPKSEIQGSQYNPDQ